MSEDCVVFKLVTGETLIATLLNETEDGIVVLNPLQVKMIPIDYGDDGYGEQAITNRFCPFTDEKDFTFDLKNIVYYKPLNPKMIDHYNKLVLAFGKESTEDHNPKEEQEHDHLFVVDGGLKFH